MESVEQLPTEISRTSENTERRARRGLTIFFAVLATFTFVPLGIAFITRSDLVFLIVVFSPAIASIVARLYLKEGFADVSFRLGSRRGRDAILIALGLPALVGVASYGFAWMTGLVGFEPTGLVGFNSFAPPSTHVQEFLGTSASPELVFTVQVVALTFLYSIPVMVVSIGEELGWRGYMLTRMIDGGIPRPVLTHSVVWAVWHLPFFFLIGYANGPVMAVAAVLLFTTITAAGFVYARFRLETGSIWPVVVLHGVWNSVIQGGFDTASTGANAALWVGESGILTTLAVVIVAIIAARGDWSIIRIPAKRGKEPVRTTMSEEAL